MLGILTAQRNDISYYYVATKSASPSPHHSEDFDKQSIMTVGD